MLKVKIELKNASFIADGREGQWEYSSLLLKMNHCYLSTQATTIAFAFVFAPTRKGEEKVSKKESGMEHYFSTSVTLNDEDRTCGSAKVGFFFFP